MIFPSSAAVVDLGVAVVVDLIPLFLRTQTKTTTEVTKTTPTRIWLQHHFWLGKKEILKKTNLNY